MPVPSGPQFRFFHGTTSGFNPNDEILPPSMRSSDIKPLYDETEPDAAYASRSPEQAWFWAESAWHKAQHDNPRPRVYGVEPLGKVLDDLHSLSDEDVRTREGWRVLGEVPMPKDLGTPEEWESNKQYD
jgi:hypothetical protein